MHLSVGPFTDGRVRGRTDRILRGGSQPDAPYALAKIAHRVGDSLSHKVLELRLFGAFYLFLSTGINQLYFQTR